MLVLKNEGNTLEGQRSFQVFTALPLLDIGSSFKKVGIKVTYPFVLPPHIVVSFDVVAKLVVVIPLDEVITKVNSAIQDEQHLLEVTRNSSICRRLKASVIVQRVGVNCYFKQQTLLGTV